MSSPQGERHLECFLISIATPGKHSVPRHQQKPGQFCLFVRVLDLFFLRISFFTPL